MRFGPLSRWRPRPNSSLLRGALLGIALVLVSRILINESRFPDRLVAPLMGSSTPLGPDVDAIVVPGAGVTGFCTPNNHGIQRTLVAAQLYHAHGQPLVVFAGGGSSTCAVSDSMAELATRLGVPRDRVRVDRTSKSTWENAVRSDAILRSAGARRIRLVTDALHMRRAVACFSRFGYEIERTIVPVPLGYTDNIEILYMAAYEIAATTYYQWRGYMSAGLAPPALVESVRERIPTTGVKDGFDRDRRLMSVPIKNPDGPLVLLGASYAKGLQPNHLGGVSLVNKGVAGEQSFELLSRFDPDVVNAGPRAVVIWGFINDVFRTPRTDLSRGLARVRENIAAMVERARGAGVEPILATEVTLAKPPGAREALATWVGWLRGKQGYQDYINSHVRDTNAWLREFARAEGLVVLDFEAVLSDGSGMRVGRFATADGSHISAEGYAALTAYSEPILRAHFAGR